MGNDNARGFSNFRNLLSLRRLYDLRKDTFYSNSLYLTLSRMTSTVAGLVFWLVAAKLYSQSDVGMATTLISTSLLASVIAQFGFGQSIIRYFPNYDQSKILGTALRLVTLSSILIGLVFVLLTAWWAPDLVMTGGNTAFFLILALATSIISITGYAFIAGRKAKHNFYQNLVLGSRVLFLLPLVLLGSLGIVMSMTFSCIIVIVYSAIIIYRWGLRMSRVDWSFLRHSIWFSAGNYFSTMLMTVPTLIMPLIIFGSLGPSEAAVYYMASSISYAAAVVPNACSDSLFVEGSHGEQLRKNAIKSLKTSFLILIPIAVGMFLLGGWLLGILGDDYAAGGTEVLRLMVVSIFFYTFFVVLMAWAKVMKNIRVIVILSLVNCLLTIVLSYLLIGPYGVNGVGYAFIASYAVSSFVGGVMVLRGRHGPSVSIDQTV